MSNLPMTTFNREVIAINRELKKLETHDGPVTGYDLIAKWNTARTNIFHVLTRLRSFAWKMEIYEMVASTLYELQQRVEQLPYVPDIRTVIRTQNLLALSPHIVVTEDVQPDKQASPELKRVTVMNNDGTVLFDQDFLPQRVQKESLPSWNPSTKQTSQTAESILLTQVWDDLTKALSGQYILTYNLSFIQMQLDVTSERFQLPNLVLIGESILDVYFSYFGTTITPSGENFEDALPILTAVFDQLGTPFFRKASYTTIERATRITNILQGIANCTLTPPSQFT